MPGGDPGNGLWRQTVGGDEHPAHLVAANPGNIPFVVDNIAEKDGVVVVIGLGGGLVGHMGVEGVFDLTAKKDDLLGILDL